MCHVFMPPHINIQGSNSSLGFSGSVGQGQAPNGANVTMEQNTEDFVKMFKGELNPTQAFMGGKLKIKGDMMMAMKLEKLMKQMKSKL